MKKLVAVIVVLAIVSLFSCASGGTAPYIGDGNKGMSLAVLVPNPNGLPTEQNYLPTMVQGVLVGDISKYSAIRVLDRQTLEKTLKETESGIYKNEADYGQLGQIANVDYALMGNITKTGLGYAMQIQVVGTGKNNIGVTKASYSGSCTVEELDNFTGIRKASLELLTQMGVVLTSSAKQELSGAAMTNQVNAQISLAQGIAAQRSGNIVEMMARFYEANSYDPSLVEATTRANAVSSTIRTGSLGQNFRNDLAWRDEWKKILDDASNYLFSKGFVIAEVSYKNLGLKTGRADYQNGTMEFTYNPYNIWIKPMPFPRAYIKLVDDLNKGLRATGRNRDWQLEPLNIRRVLSCEGSFDLSVILKDGNGKEISSESFEIGYGTKTLGFVVGFGAEHTPIITPVLIHYGNMFNFPFSEYLLIFPWFLMEEYTRLVLPGEKLSIGRYIKYDDGGTFRVSASNITDQMSIEVTANDNRVRVIQE